MLEVHAASVERGIFSWMPVTAEGGLMPEGEYDEQSFEARGWKIGTAVVLECRTKLSDCAKL